jgi:hypothetical protein
MKGMDCKLLSLGGAEKHQSNLHGNGGEKKRNNFGKLLHQNGNYEITCNNLNSFYCTISS